jgi:hypothetical protein
MLLLETCDCTGAEPDVPGEWLSGNVRRAEEGEQARSHLPHS